MPSPKAIADTTVVLAGAGLVAGGLVYAGLWPRSQVFGRVIVAGRDPGEIALTYDDGPNDSATERLLEVLARHEVRATFFLIGRFVRQRPQLARAVAAAGHVVGNHTMTHPWLAWQSARRVREELMGCNAILEDAVGQPVRFFRPPHGARRPYVLRLAREMGMATVQWNVTTFDWNPLAPETILANATRGIALNQRRKRGSNVLMHDGGDTGMGQPRLPTVEATSRLLNLYRGPEVRFVTVDAWANDL